MKPKQLSLLFLTIIITLLFIGCTMVDAPAPSSQTTPDLNPTAAPLADIVPSSPTDEPGSGVAAMQAPTDTPTDIIPDQSGEIIYNEAQIETSEIAILESFPVRINLTINGSFPDGCTTIDQITQRQQDNTFFINVIIARPAEPMCTQEIIPFEEVISLDVRGLQAGEYQVVINEVNQGSFQLTIDNALPDEADETNQANENNESNENNNEEQSEQTTPAQTMPPVNDPAYERIFIPATGAAVTVPVDWQRTDFRWSPSAEEAAYIGLDWVEVDLEWTPTAMLPAEATLISREAVEMSWGEALRFQLEIKDSNNQLVAIEEHLIGPLNQNVVYNFYAGGSTYQELQNAATIYEIMANSLVIEATPAFAELPESCTPNVARALYVDAQQRYCLLYPAYYPKPTEQENIVNILGLPPDNNLASMVASLFIQIDGPAGGRTVGQVVDQVVSQVNDLPITRRQVTLAGEDAVLVEGLPGRFSSRQLFAVHDDTIYHITLMPVENASPQVSEEVEMLWEIATTSFTFLP